MALDQLYNVNFGKNCANATGSTGVGYTLLDVSGSTVNPRTTSGVYQLTSGSGIYSAYISFPDEFRGQVLWDTGAAFNTVQYASEQFNVEANNPLVSEINKTVNLMSSTVGTLYDYSAGRWRIDTSTNQMIFFKEDNSTEIGRFNLYDATGSLTSIAPMERQRV